MPVLQVENVTKRYRASGEDVVALDGVSLSARAGEFISIVGRSGCGKTTLLNLSGAMDFPSSGEILIRGRSTRGLGDRELTAIRREQVGFVFQFFQLLPTLTAVENVMLPMDFCKMFGASERKPRALELLNMVGVLDQAEKLPSTLSGGQQQRVAIARALANDPPIVIADEPTGNLDSETGAAISQLFSHLVTSGKTVLIVTHDREVASDAGNVVTITDGMVSSQRVARLA